MEFNLAFKGLIKSETDSYFEITKIFVVLVNKCS